MTYIDYTYFWPAIFGTCFGVVLLITHAKKYFKTVYILSGRGRAQLLLGYRRSLRIIKYVLLFFALLFFSAALLKIQRDDTKVTVQNEGWQVMVALDISRSMRGADVPISRIAYAKEKINALLRALPCAKVGLVLFSADAFIQCPLTSDKEAFSLFLNHVDTENISAGGTAITRALALITDLFKREGNQKKIALLVTDGEEFTENSAQAVNYKSDNIVLCALGIGTPTGAPVPILDQEGQVQGYERDEQGVVIMSRLNENYLETITQAHGGLYLRADERGNDIEKLVQFITTSEKEYFDDASLDVRWDSFPLFLFGGLICLMLDAIL